MSAGGDARIVILGGGIGGLAAAAFLDQRGIGADVYEQAPALTEVGAGLVVAPNAAKLVRRLDGGDFLEDRAVRLDVGWEFRRWQDGTVLSAEDLTDRCRLLYGEDTYTAHRADLLDTVRRAVPAERVHLGKKALSLELRGATTRVTFSDGQTVDADVVIGADGIHSVVRAAITPEAAPTDSGICAFRALVPADEAPEFARRRSQTLWIGPRHHLVHYPVSGGRQINIVAFAPAGDYTTESWTAMATLEEFLAEFDGWDERLLDLVRAAGTPGRWALLDRAPLTSWTRGTVALLGDAAHPMFPFFAQGAAQALEDGAVLAECLAQSLDDPAEALARYERLRLPRTTRLQLVSHDRARINHLPDGPDQRERDSGFGKQDPLEANGWIYGYEPWAAMQDS